VLYCFNYKLNNKSIWFHFLQKCLKPGIFTFNPVSTLNAKNAACLYAQIVHKLQKLIATSNFWTPEGWHKCAVLRRQTFSDMYFWDAVYSHLPVFYYPHWLQPTCMLYILWFTLAWTLYHWHGISQFWTIILNPSGETVGQARVPVLASCMCVCVCVCYICTVYNFKFWVVDINT
jgi:hypothetical protein